MIFGDTHLYSTNPSIPRIESPNFLSMHSFGFIFLQFDFSIVSEFLIQFDFDCCGAKWNGYVRRNCTLGEPILMAMAISFFQTTPPSDSTPIFQRSAALIEILGKTPLYTFLKLQAMGWDMGKEEKKFVGDGGQWRNWQWLWRWTVVTHFGEKEVLTK